MLQQNTPEGRTPPSLRRPALVQMAQLFVDPVGFLERCRDRLGPVFRVPYPGSPPFVYVADSDLARELFRHDRDIGRAGEAREPYLEPLVGPSSLLCLEGDRWQQQRSLIAPPLHGERIASWRDQIEAIAVAEIERLPRGEPTELHPRMQAITLEVILRLVFGIDDADRLGRLRELLPALLDSVSLVFISPTLRARLQRPLAMRIPGNPMRRFSRRRAEVDELLYDEIRRRRALDAERLAERSDLLSVLLLARDEQGQGLSDGELRDELITLLAAGHETTATGLAWSFERLARHRDVADRLRGEIADDDGTAYLDAVIKEVLRVRPVVFDTPRALAEPLEIGGREIPAGWFIAAAIPLVHLEAGRFPDPERFDPGRFEGGDAPVVAWIPFGGGRRRCVGSRLALLEMQVVIAALLERLELEPAAAADERPRVRGVTLAPAHGARVVLGARG